MDGNPVEHVPEVDEGGDLESFACGGETAEDPCGLPTALAAEEQPGAKVQREGGDAPNTPLWSTWP